MKADACLLQTLRITLFGIFAAASLCIAQTGTFQQVPGSLAQISVGADGTVWGLDSNQNIFTWDSSTSQFIQIPGQLTQIAVGNANAVWGINAQNQIFRWDAANQSWTYILGSLIQIAVGADGDVWGVNADQQVYHYNQQAQSWDYIIGGLGAAFFGFNTQVEVGNDGSVYILDQYGLGFYAPYWYNPGTRQFEGVPGTIALLNPNNELMNTLAVGADGDLWSAGPNYTFHYSLLQPEWVPNASALITQLAVGSAANVWGILAANYGSGPMDGPIYHWDAQSANWVSVPGALTQIAAGADGSVWGVNSAHQVFHYVQPAQPYNSLIPLPGSLTQISVGVDGTAWALDANGLIYIFDRGTLSWQNVSGALARISVASTANVWGVNAEGQIWRWGERTADAWNAVPGELNQIGVSSNAPYFETEYPAYPPVFGINAFNQTYVYNNGGWVNIPGSLAQISVGADGTAWGVNAQQQIYQYDSTSNSWANVPGSLSQISVGNAANVWGVNAEQQVYRYDASIPGWDLIAGASLTQIAVAFDGTVWGVNAEGSLYQWSSATQSFNFVANGVTNVAVGNDSAVFAWNKSTGATYWYF
jgi:virginiamycin B lyase